MRCDPLMLDYHAHYDRIRSSMTRRREDAKTERSVTINTRGDIAASRGTAAKNTREIVAKSKTR